MASTAVKLITLFGGGNYLSTILSTGPIALWPLSETSGTAAICEPTTYNGSHNAVTLNALTFPAGTPAPAYNGTTSYTNIYSAALASAFNGSEGSFMLWWRVSAAGVWTDNAQRHVFNFYVDASNAISMRKETTNIMRAVYVAGGTTSILVETTQPVIWTNTVVTWSRSAGANGEFRLFINGTQDGATATNIGNWTGAPISTRTILAAFSTTAAQWTGNLAFAALWTRALAPAEIATFAPSSFLV
jgi:hypothetical protein